MQVILVDQNDLSNGWATPVPYNTIEISAAAPRAESSIGNTDDWLRLVFIHEYTHIVHLSRARRLDWRPAAWLRPAAVALSQSLSAALGIEGIATWQESASTGRRPRRRPAISG